jgi:hypothetical protein
VGSTAAIVTFEENEPFRKSILGVEEDLYRTMGKRARGKFGRCDGVYIVGWGRLYMLTSAHYRFERRVNESGTKRFTTVRNQKELRILCVPVLPVDYLA